MTRPRTFALAAVSFSMAAGLATAQTVTVTKATPKSPIELALNGTAIGSAVADADGIASVDVNLPAHGGKNQTDVRLAVETCPNLVRVQLIEVAIELPPPATDCTRAGIAGLYVMRRNSTFVVDASPSPAVWLTQGSPPRSWLYPGAAGAEGEGFGGPLPTGLMISAGGGLASFADAITVACGDVGCSGKRTRGDLNAAATFWFAKALALEVAFVRPADVTASGSGTGYQFSSTLETRLVTVAAKVGVTAGRARIYGLGGAAYHWANSTTTQTTDSSTITVNGVTTTIPGGTQSLGITAPDWGWLAGGGLEIWVKRPFAFYLEGIFAPIKGTDKNGGEPRIDDHVISIVGGIRFHLWR